MIVFGGSAGETGSETGGNGASKTTFLGTTRLAADLMLLLLDSSESLSAETLDSSLEESLSSSEGGLFRETFLAYFASCRLSRLYLRTEAVLT
jgi:hypothetical protein